MEHEEIKIAKLLSEFLLNNEFIKNLSESGISKFIKLDNFRFIRFFQSDCKLGIDLINLNDNNISNLNTYLFNGKGYLESSFTMEIKAIFENTSITEYMKIGPDLEKDSELEKIRNLALAKFKLYSDKKENFMQKWFNKNKKCFNLLKKIFFPKTLLLEEPNEDYYNLKELFTSIVNKQLSFSTIFN